MKHLKEFIEINVLDNAEHLEIKHSQVSKYLFAAAELLDKGSCPWADHRLLRNPHMLSRELRKEADIMQNDLKIIDVKTIKMCMILADEIDLKFGL